MISKLKPAIRSPDDNDIKLSGDYLIVFEWIYIMILL